MRFPVRPTALFAAGLLLAFAGCQTPGSIRVGAAAAPQLAPAPAASPDYDGDGRADVATTLVDDAAVSGIRVRSGSGSTGDFSAGQLAPDGFGVADPLLSRDLNGDGYSDLVFVTRSGQLTVMPGSATGLQLSGRRSIDLPLSSNAIIRSLTLVESPTRRLAVGVINRAAPGQVFLVQVDQAGAPTGTPTILQPGKSPLPKLTDAGSFGSALASTGSQLFVGAPSATVSGVRYAGAMVVVTLGTAGAGAASTITQGTKGVTGALGTNDYFGASLAARDGYLVVGTYGDDVGSIRSTGSVQVFTLSKGKVTPRTRLSQASAGVPGKAERYDQFGRSVAIATSCSGVTSVAVGAPAEVITPEHQSDGSAWLIPLSAVKGCPARQIYEGHGLSGRPGFRVVGFMLASIRDRGAVADDLVIIGPGSYSEGPEGRLYRWSATTLGAVYSADGFYRSAAGR